MQPKVSFTWEASWGKILTCGQLKKRGLAQANRCPLCLVSEEMMDHRLLHCTTIKGVVGSTYFFIWCLLAQA